MKKLLPLFLTTLLSACATYYPAVTVQHFGESNIAKDKEVQKMANDMDLSVAAADVKVYSGTTPAGLSLAEQGSKLIVLGGYEKKYRILGSVKAQTIVPGNAAGMYWTPKFYGKESWRKGLCYPQAPLKLLTLGIWNIVPTAWPCVAMPPSEETERKETLINSLTAGAKAMGANLIVLSNSQGTDITYVRDGRTVGASSVNMTGLSGFAVLDTTK